VSPIRSAERSRVGSGRLSDGGRGGPGEAQPKAASVTQRVRIGKDGRPERYDKLMKLSVAPWPDCPLCEDTSAIFEPFFTLSVAMERDPHLFVLLQRLFIG
jgi:hypothetical protein